MNGVGHIGSCDQLVTANNRISLFYLKGYVGENNMGEVDKDRHRETVSQRLK